MSPTFPIDGPFDCQACGACCVAAGPVAVQTHDVQVPRWRTRSVRRVVGFASFEADLGVRCMKADDGRCGALVGQPGSRVACGIYDRRPSVCAEFEPGSGYCLEARAAARERVSRTGGLPRARTRGTNRRPPLQPTAEIAT
ncbi:YkgJ family cysteine cluster protein [Methylobacterium hispanicum]|uniref:YkgJ family cysteine cluster protein n=1 Tax=Methylobacterium hispanicum TaxID=270350 RepID=UPI001EDF5362|nr:YkgJ family cysteine cluster protein [Methylobacterium hispanicum]